MPTETGIIEDIKPREKTYSVKVSKKWFGGFGKCPVNKGDSVTVDWEQKGQYQNIKKITITAEQPKQETKPTLSNSTTNDIRLQVCVKAAGGVFAGTKASPKDVGTFAKELFKEIWGDA